MGQLEQRHQRRQRRLQHRAHHRRHAQHGVERRVGGLDGQQPLAGQAAQRPGGAAHHQHRTDDAHRDPAGHGAGGEQQLADGHGQQHVHRHRAGEGRLQGVVAHALDLGVPPGHRGHHAARQQEAQRHGQALEARSQP